MQNNVNKNIHSNEALQHTLTNIQHIKIYERIEKNIFSLTIT